MRRRESDREDNNAVSCNLVIFKFIYMHISDTYSMCVLTLLCVVYPAWRNSVTHGSSGRSGGGGQVSAEEWSNGGCQGPGETALIYSGTPVHTFPCCIFLLFRISSHF